MITGFALARIGPTVFIVVFRILFLHPFYEFGHFRMRSQFFCSMVFQFEFLFRKDRVYFGMTNPVESYRFPPLARAWDQMVFID